MKRNFLLLILSIISITNIYSKTLTKTSSLIKEEIFSSPPYCNVGALLCDEYIRQVNFASINNNTTGQGCGSLGYSNHTNLSAELAIGETYPFSVLIGSGYNNNNTRIWADWNQDGDFTDSGELIHIENNNGSGFNGTFTVPENAVVGVSRLRIRLSYNTTPTPCDYQLYGETEDYTIHIIENCSSTVSISSFSPDSGPVNTWVTIQGANFYNVTGVLFDDIPASNYEILNNNTISAQVPSGFEMGAITLLEGICEIYSSSEFELMDYPNNCPGKISDLLITEIYNPSNNTHYIEVTNLTFSDIDLDYPNDYILQVRHKSFIIDLFPSTSTVNITGTIQHGEKKVYYAQNAGPLTSQPPQGISQGLNGYDEIMLVKDGDVIDFYRASSSSTYFHRRKNTVNSPSSSFISSQWNNGPTNNTSNIGIFEGQNPLTIATHPFDLAAEPCDNPTFEVEANAGAIFQWYINAPGDENWTPVTGNDYSGAQTSTLALENISNKNQNQYYATVTIGTCTLPSEAARFEELPNTRPYFRSVAGEGIWKDESSWEMAPSISGPWIDGCLYPTEDYAHMAVISPGSKISLSDTTLLLEKLVIEEGGTFVLKDEAVLMVSETNEAGLEINGTLEDRSGSNQGILILEGSTWKLGPNGTILQTGGNDPYGFIGSYENGISNIPASGNWIIRSENGSDPKFATIGAYYPNLTFESESGTWNPSSANGRFSGSAGTAVIKGNLDIGGTGSGTVNITNQNNFNQPILVEGDLIVREGSILTNQGNVSGRGFEVKGDVQVYGELFLNASNQGELFLSGTTDQFISGTGSITTSNLLVDKSNGSLHISGIQPEVNQNLLLNNGIIHMNSDADHLFLRAGATATGGSASAYIDGFIRKEGNDDFLFPVGQNGIYHPVEITSLSDPTTVFAARYSTTSHPVPVPFSSNFPEMEAQCDYWTLNRVSGSSPAIVTLHYGENECYPEESAGEFYHYSIGRWNGSEWEAPISQGVVNAHYGIITSATPISNFSDFAILTNAGIGVLPVEWIDFSAKEDNKNVLLSWSTGSETNNDYFDVMRSSDGYHFSTIGKIDGAGNTHFKSDYHFTDERPFPGQNYYMLEQVDFDGKRNPSVIREVNLSEEGLSILRINNSAQGMDLVISAPRNNTVVSLLDLKGSVIYREIISQGTKYLTIPLKNLPAEIYLLHLSDGVEIYSTKVAGW